MAIKSFVLAVHLIAVGIASAGPLFCILLSWRGGEGESESLRAGHRLAWISVVSLVVGIGLGAVSLLMVREGYWDVFKRIPDRALWFALAELLFSLVCLVVYARFWKRLSKAPWLANLIAVISVTNLLYHFPPLMIAVGQLTSGATHAKSVTLNRPTMLELFSLPEAIASWLHFVLASIAVSGGAALWLLARVNGAEQQTKPLEKRTRFVAGIVLGVSLLQLPTGLWLLTTISNQSRSALMGSSPLAGLAFLVALLTMFLMLGRLLKVALGEFEGRDLKISFALLCAVMFLMTCTTRATRDRDRESASSTGLTTLTSTTVNNF